jgi:hypothetical protein
MAESEGEMAEPSHVEPSDIEEIRRQADDFARRRYEDVFKCFEQLLKPVSAGREGNPNRPSDTRPKQS